MFLKALKEYILLDIGDYFEGVSFPINIFILSICLGLCIASFFVTWHKRYTYTTLHSMLRRDAIGKENAKTLRQLRLDGVKSIRWALARKGQLTYVVKMAESESCDTETCDEGEKIPASSEGDEGETAAPVSNNEAPAPAKSAYSDAIDFENARFYIDEDKLSRAKQLTEKDAPGYFSAAIWSLLIMALALTVTLFMQDILTFLSALV